MKWSLCSHRLLPTESLTWDDVCELWDVGIYTAEEVGRIASLFFEGPELRAVLKVIEKVEMDSFSPGTMKQVQGNVCRALPRGGKRLLRGQAQNFSLEVKHRISVPEASPPRRP
jgi:hypothetical protein